MPGIKASNQVALYCPIFQFDTEIILQCNTVLSTTPSPLLFCKSSENWSTKSPFIKCTSFIIEGKTLSSKSSPSLRNISGSMVACGRASTRRPMLTICKSGKGVWLYNKKSIIFILLTKCEGCTVRISAQGLDSTDRVWRGPCKKDRGPIFSQYGPEQAWLIRDLLYDWRKLWRFFTNFM